MQTLSFFFHVASFFAVVACLWWLIRLKAQVAFVERLFRALPNGSLVDRPDRVLERLSALWGAGFVRDSGPVCRPAVVRVSKLLVVHMECGIKEVRLQSGQPPVATFSLSRSSAIIEEDQRQIERDFANSIQVRLVLAPE